MAPEWLKSRLFVFQNALIDDIGLCGEKTHLFNEPGSVFRLPDVTNLTKHINVVCLQVCHRSVYVLLCAATHHHLGLK